MRRPIMPTALVLAVITGIWVGQAYSLFAPLDPTERFVPAVDDGEGVVRRFYDAVEVLLDTGDPAAVHGVVGTDFVDYSARVGTEPTRDGLVRYLASLRRAFPDLGLEPRDVVTQRDRVVVRLDLTGAEGGSFLGMPVAGARPWSQVDVFRIVGDRIVEHWGDASDQSLLEQLVSDRLTVPFGAATIPALSRKTYAPGAGDRDIPARGPLIVFVEQGTVGIAADGDAAVLRSNADSSGASPTHDPAETGEFVTMVPGDLMVVTATAKIETRNDAPTPADILVFSLSPPEVPPMYSAGEPPIPTGVTVRPLAGGVQTTLLPGLQAVTIGRAMLAPGTGFATHDTIGRELVIVEAGTLSLTITGGTAWLRHPDSRTTAADGVVEVAAGMSLGVPPEAVAAYRNDGPRPLALLVVTIVPIGAAVHADYGA